MWDEKYYLPGTDGLYDSAFQCIQKSLVVYLIEPHASVMTGPGAEFISAKVNWLNV